MSNISMDPDLVLGCLKYRDLRYLLNDNKGNYVKEELLHPNYICGIFDSFNEVSEYWFNLANQIRNFVQEFDGVLEPDFETHLSELDFLDYNASVVTQGGMLNIRTEASSKSAILGKLSDDTKLSVLDDNPVNGFYQVEYLDEKGVARKGYVSADYIEKDYQNVANLSGNSSNTPFEHEQPIVYDTPISDIEHEQPIAYDTPITNLEHEQPVVKDIPLNTNESTFKYVNTKSANGHLNVRTSPSVENSKVIDMLDNNSQVEVIGKDGDWYKILHNGIEGYVKANYLKDTK